MAENDSRGGGYRTRKRISEIEDLLQNIPTDQQAREDAILQELFGRFVVIPENRKLIHRQWRLSFEEETEPDQAVIRRELRQRLEAFAAVELPKIERELFPKK